MSSEPTTELVHSFSQPIAAKYGVHAAIVLSYFGHKIPKSTHVHDTRRWYYITYRELADRYPYMSLNAVYHAAKRLTAANGLLLTGNYNRWKQDKTTWYAFKEEHYPNQLATEPRYFKCCDAVAYGLAEAVILNNLTHWIEKNRTEAPTRRYQAASPEKLSQILPFSRTSIQRALDNLVKQNVLIKRAPSDRRKPNEYALASIIELEGSGPDTNEAAQSVFVSEQQPKIGSSPESKIGGPTRDIAGPSTNMGSPNTNTGGPTRDNITHLEDTYCKDTYLEDVCLKEDHFKAASLVGNSLTHSNLADSSRSFADSIDSSSTAKLIDVAAPKLADPHSVTPALVSNLSVSAKESKWPIGDQNDPRFSFLDREVHEACYDVMLLHADSDDVLVKGMGLGLVNAISALIDATEPSQIDQLLSITTQRELNAKLVEWAARFLSQYYAKHFSTATEPKDQELWHEFVRQGICFLNMSFHIHHFAMPSVYFGSPHYNKIVVEMLLRLRPYHETLASEKRQQCLNKRSIQFASPDHDKEDDASLSAAEKMQVFNQSLQARNRMGRFDKFGQFTEMVVSIHRNTLNLVRQFFQLNPEFTPAHLNSVIDRCLELGPIDSYEEDPQWHAKNGHKISLLVTNLSLIAGQLNLLSHIPAIVPLPYEEKAAELELAA